MHQPVLVEPVLQFTRGLDASVFVDATCGYFGHSAVLLGALKNVKQYIGIDRDPAAIVHCRQMSASFPEVHSEFYQFEFSQVGEILRKSGLTADVLLFDFGVSSPQLDQPERGFSFMADGPLDMRMDPTDEGTLRASDVVNDFTWQELARVFSQFGEEKMSKKIAKAIEKAREKGRIETTVQLREIILSVKPNRNKKKSHPATKCFQALRIFINRELEQIESALDEALTILSPGGTLLCISFHSLEDRLVKHKFSYWCCDCICPPKFPVCRCDKRAAGKSLTRKPLFADEQESEENPRSRSARLRVFRKSKQDGTNSI